MSGRMENMLRMWASIRRSRTRQNVSFNKDIKLPRSNIFNKTDGHVDRGGPEFDVHGGYATLQDHGGA